jgi:hypothetical protein
VLLGGPVGAPAAAQNLGVTTQLLEKECDGPAAHHRLPFRGFDRLESIVPVAIAIPDEVCAGNEPLAYRGDQLFNVSRNRIYGNGSFQVVLASPR